MFRRMLQSTSYGQSPRLAGSLRSTASRIFFSILSRARLVIRSPRSTLLTQRSAKFLSEKSSASGHMAMESELTRARSSDSHRSLCSMERGESSGTAKFQSRREITDLAHVFTYFDADGDGKISPSELFAALSSVNGGSEKVPSRKEVGRMMKEFDSHGDGFIDLEDFLRLNTLSDMKEAEADRVLSEAFGLLVEEEEGGSITPRGLQEMMWRLLGEERTLDDCVLMIKHFDLDGDGVVSFHEFKHMMTA